MTKEENAKHYDLEERTFAFAQRVRAFVQTKATVLLVLVIWISNLGFVSDCPKRGNQVVVLRISDIYLPGGVGDSERDAPAARRVAGVLKEC